MTVGVTAKPRPSAFRGIVTVYSCGQSWRAVGSEHDQRWSLWNKTTRLLEVRVFDGGWWTHRETAVDVAGTKTIYTE